MHGVNRLAVLLCLEVPLSATFASVVLRPVGTMDAGDRAARGGKNRPARRSDRIVGPKVEGARVENTRLPDSSALLCLLMWIRENGHSVPFPRFRRTGTIGDKPFESW
jgi:hypothetical protein